MPIYRKTGPKATELGRPKIRHRTLVKGKAAQVQAKVNQDAASDMRQNGFDKTLSLSEAIARAADSGIDEAAVRAGLNAGEFSWEKKGPIRYEISRWSLDQWIATHTP
jgi:hypothetical protein